jgi:hypothetical protein
MAKGKRTKVLSDEWDVTGRQRMKDNKRRLKVLPRILKVSLDFVEVLSTIALLVIRYSLFE